MGKFVEIGALVEKKIGDEAYEKIYNLEVEVLPTNKPMVRKDLPDFVYKDEFGEYLRCLFDGRKPNVDFVDPFRTFILTSRMLGTLSKLTHKRRLRKTYFTISQYSTY